MKLHLVELPDSPRDAWRWLEQRIASLRLGEVVAELAALPGATMSPLSLKDSLSGPLKRVLTEGLSVLHDQDLRVLLREPALLLDLQEWVLAEGGPYWDRLLAASAEVDEKSHAARDKVAQRVAKKAAKRAAWAGTPPLPPPPQTSPAPPQASAPPVAPPEEVALVTPAAGISLPWLLAATGFMTALSLLVGFFIHDAINKPQGSSVAVAPAQSPAIAWGWAEPDALPQRASATQYLIALADAAEQWFNKQPDNAPALARRILEFRQGCSTLLLSEHRPLDDTSRAWLRSKCRKLADSLDEQLARLESGAAPSDVRRSVDQLARTVASELRGDGVAHF